MANLKTELWKTAKHTYELAVCLGVAIFVVKYLPASAVYQPVMLLVLAATAKFLRVSKKSPVPDWVNGK